MQNGPLQPSSTNQTWSQQMQQQPQIIAQNMHPQSHQPAPTMQSQTLSLNPSMQHQQQTLAPSILQQSHTLTPAMQQQTHQLATSIQQQVLTPSMHQQQPNTAAPVAIHQQTHTMSGPHQPQHSHTLVTSMQQQTHIMAPSMQATFVQQQQVQPQQIILNGPSVATTPSNVTMVTSANIQQHTGVHLSQPIHSNQQPNVSMATIILPNQQVHSQMASNAPASVTVPSSSAPQSQPSVQPGNALFDSKRLVELVQEVDPNLQLDDEVEEFLLELADDFIEQVSEKACRLAKHRGATTLEAKDLQLTLERDWNYYVPGFPSEESRQVKKSHVTEAHKQRMAIIRKQMKKF